MRKFISVPLREPTGTVSLEPGFSLPKKDLQVIAFLQDPKTMAIVSAANSHL